MMKTIADLLNKDYIRLTTSIAEKQSLLVDAQAAYDASIQAGAECKNRLFELFASANITDVVHILTTEGILLEIDPIAKTITEVK